MGSLITCDVFSYTVYISILHLVTPYILTTSALLLWGAPTHKTYSISVSCMYAFADHGIGIAHTHAGGYLINEVINNYGL